MLNLRCIFLEGYVYYLMYGFDGLVFLYYMSELFDVYVKVRDEVVNVEWFVVFGDCIMDGNVNCLEVDLFLGVFKVGWNW